MTTRTSPTKVVKTADIYEVFLLSCLIMIFPQKEKLFVNLWEAL